MSRICRSAAFTLSRPWQPQKGCGADSRQGRGGQLTRGWVGWKEGKTQGPTDAKVGHYTLSALDGFSTSQHQAYLGKFRGVACEGARGGEKRLLCGRGWGEGAGNWVCLCALPAELCSLLFWPTGGETGQLFLDPTTGEARVLARSRPLDLAP